MQGAIVFENQGSGLLLRRFELRRRREFAWGRAVGGGAVSELPVSIPSKRMQGAIVFENQGVIRSCGDLSYTGGENLRGGRAVGGGTVSELPVSHSFQTHAKSHRF